VAETPQKVNGGSSPALQKRRQYDVPADKFVLVWQASGSPQEASDRLGMPKPIVLARASQYRSAGVKIKNFPRGQGRALDVAYLNSLITKPEAGSTPEQ
jgi:hypothetical protein